MSAPGRRLPRRLALLRHGRTAWNREGRLQGSADIPLDKEGRAELRALSLPPPWDEARLFSSPLSRAVETAEITGRRRPEIVDALREMNWGDWEGRSDAELRAVGAAPPPIEEWGWSFRPPQGESLAELAARLRGWLVAAHQRDDWSMAVAVTHIGVIRVMLGLALGWDFDRPAPVRVKRARLYPFEVTMHGELRLLGDPVRLIREAPETGSKAAAP